MQVKETGAKGISHCSSQGKMGAVGSREPSVALWKPEDEHWFPDMGWFLFSLFFNGVSVKLNVDKNTPDHHFQ